MDQELLKEGGAAQLLGVSAQTLQRWRMLGVGPKAIKLAGSTIRYRKIDLEAWIEAQPVIGGLEEVA